MLYWPDRLLERTAAGVSRECGSKVLFVAALVAGVGLFAIRLHNADSWNTGHYTYYIEPR
jgi:hypothetical protein